MYKLFFSVLCEKATFQILRTHRFLKELGGSTQSKQWRMKLLKRAETSRITVLNIRKLYLYFACLFTLSGAGESGQQTLSFSPS